MDRMHASRIFDPNEGSGSMLVASFSDTSSWQRELRDLESERAEKEIRRLMSQRTGVCG